MDATSSAFFTEEFCDDCALSIEGVCWASVKGVACRIASLWIGLAGCRLSCSDTKK